MKNVARIAKVFKGIQLADGERLHVGIDCHKNSFHVSVWSNMRGLLKTWVQPAWADTLVKILHPYKDVIEGIVYEAGPTGYGLVRVLRAGGFHAEVVAPSKTPTTPGQDSKSDRLDSRKLAEYEAKGLLRPIQVPTEQEEADRQVVRTRDQLCTKLRIIKTQIRSFLLMHGIKEPTGLDHWTDKSLRELRGLKIKEDLGACLDIMLDDFDYLKKQLRRATKLMEKTANSERHKKDVENLRSVDGVGVVTAMTFKTELIAPKRFKGKKQVARMLGLAPKVSQSGERRREGHLMKSANSRMRWVLVEASWVWTRKDPNAREKYLKLLRKTGSKKKAIVAMARRLGIILWQILIKEEPYRWAA